MSVSILVASTDEHFREVVRESLLNMPNAKLVAEYPEITMNLYVRVLQDLERHPDAALFVEIARLRPAPPLAETPFRVLLPAFMISELRRACEIGFRENLLFSSEGYKESPGVTSVGTSILAMVGKPHRRLRSAAQPLFKRPKVLNWWNKRWIEETVDVLLDRLLDEETTDLNHTLCARLPMATVTRAIGLEGEDDLVDPRQRDHRRGWQAGQ